VKILTYEQWYNMMKPYAEVCDECDGKKYQECVSCAGTGYKGISRDDYREAVEQDLEKLKAWQGE